MRRVLLLAALLALILPSTASASLLSDSLAAARAYWGRDVPCLSIQLDRDAKSYLARAELGGCTMALAGRWFATRPRIACETLVHEWGHLLGYPHTRDDGLMDPLRLSIALVPQCAKWDAPMAKGLPYVKVRRSRRTGALARRLGNKLETTRREWVRTHAKIR